MELLLIPLSKNELLIEADGWQGIVKVKALEIARAEIVVLRQNNEIDKAEEIKAKTAAAKAQLEKVLEKVDESNATGDPDKVSEAQQAAADAHDLIQQVATSVDEIVDAAKQTAEIKHPRRRQGYDLRLDFSQGVGYLPRGWHPLGGQYRKFCRDPRVRLVPFQASQSRDAQGHVASGSTRTVGGFPGQVGALGGDDHRYHLGTFGN